MTPPIVKRYIIAFEKYKWIGLASFGLVVIGSTVVAIQPEPPVTYIAESALAYNGPTVSFSKTGDEIQEQGKELTPQVLLSNRVLETVSAKVKVQPKTIAKNVVVQLPVRNSKSGKLESTTIVLKLSLIHI